MSDRNDKRPEWKHKISEADVEWLSSGIIKITHHCEMTGADTSRDWIELHKKDGKRKFPSSFLNDNGYFQFKPNWRELVTPTYQGNQALKNLNDIKAWEKANEEERAAYERLRAKFQG